MEVNVTSSTNDVSGSVMAYSYPTQTMSISGLNSGTTYKYCVAATNDSDVLIGEPDVMCGNFTTVMYDNGKYTCTYVYEHS